MLPMNIFCVLGADTKLVNSLLNKTVDRSSILGIVTHENCSASPTGDFVVLYCRHGIITIKTKRVWS